MSKAERILAAVRDTPRARVFLMSAAALAKAGNAGGAAWWLAEAADATLDAHPEIRYLGVDPLALAAALEDYVYDRPVNLVLRKDLLN
jgi:hypothetical protein